MVMVESTFKNRNLKQLKGRAGEQSSPVVQLPSHAFESSFCNLAVTRHSFQLLKTGNMVCPSLGVPLILHVPFLPWL